jgi:hypothetical protein
VTDFHEAGYMNVPPTELARRLETERDPAKRRAMRRALEAWRVTQGNPLAKSARRVARSWMASFLSL